MSLSSVWGGCGLDSVCGRIVNEFSMRRQDVSVVGVEIDADAAQMLRDVGRGGGVRNG